MDVNKNAWAPCLAFVAHTQNPIAETSLFPNAEQNETSLG